MVMVMVVDAGGSMSPPPWPSGHVRDTMMLWLLQVATRRVKQANKADIPMMDDHVSKIEHIGRETVKKLSEMRSAASEV